MAYLPSVPGGQLNGHFSVDVLAAHTSDSVEFLDLKIMSCTDLVRAYNTYLGSMDKNDQMTC